jgi:hypothetical protein
MSAASLAVEGRAGGAMGSSQMDLAPESVLQSTAAEANEFEAEPGAVAPMERADDEGVFEGTPEPRSLTDCAGGEEQA